ncbi:MAG: Fibrillarin-like rRNA/tRNA 2'-O-methyltransferase [Promethearchaeota archaeon]|nr:MAG: Fibrillarin-like rRNA/tRNA 2'-O-methyltransferase [Candidatus Lokiarchaeota archaeon]
MSKVNIREHPRFNNVFISGSLENASLYTKNVVPGKQIYGEKLIMREGREYRKWNPYHSKLAAILTKNPTTNFLTKNKNCLYLGAASGTTVSHLSDVLEEGIIYAVEFAERSIRQLIQNTSERRNIIPILGDARFPVEYARNFFTEIDLIYQDVAQPNQAEIAVKNCEYYLKEEGLLILAIKSQSIDSVSKSSEVYKKEQKILEDSGLEVVESVNIHRYAANHIVLVAKNEVI